MMADLQFPLPPERPPNGGRNLNMQPTMQYMADVQAWGVACGVLLGRELIAAIDRVATAIREQTDKTTWGGQ
jgi:hypothetical protein